VAPAHELGVLSLSLETTLPSNAVVSRYVLLLGARPAGIAAAGDVAAVRVEGTQAVLDFGTLRTVRGVQLDGGAGVQIAAVSFWNGLKFAASLVAQAGEQISFDATRTERLQLDVAGLAAKPEPERWLAEHTQVLLGDSPADLELRLDGGAVIWSHAGPVRPGTGGWAADGSTRVDVISALAPLIGDATAKDGDSATLRFLLTARAPAILRLELAADPYFDRIRRVVPKPDELSFTAEGRLVAALPLPAEARSIREVRFTAVGTFASPRVFAPVEPPVSADADLVVDADHAFCVRLPSLLDDGGELAGELAGVRLPLRAASGGAEGRIVIWAGEGNGEPAEPLEGGATDPVTLEPPVSPDEEWTFFALRRPLPLVNGRPLWAALTMARGSVTWKLIAGAAGSGFEIQELRRGGPAGPWRPLPSIFSRGSALASLRGRVRAVFLPAKANPVAALRMRLTTAAAPIVELTPLPRGVPVVLRLPQLAPTAGLEVTSWGAGTVSLRDVDVVWSTQSSHPTPREPAGELSASVVPTAEAVFSG
jgi:hypothetical protein